MNHSSHFQEKWGTEKTDADVSSAHGGNVKDHMPRPVVIVLDMLRLGLDPTINSCCSVHRHRSRRNLVC